MNNEEMPEEKGEPEDLLRETVAFWEDKVDESRRKFRNVHEQYAQYSRWIAGDMSDVVGEVRSSLRCRTQDVVPVNLLSLVARNWRGEMMFRAPRAFSKFIQGMGQAVFTPELATIETRLLNDWIEDVDFFTVGRRALTDGFLAHLFAVKVGYSAEIGIDQDLVDSERARAKMEDTEYLASGGAKKPRIRDTDLHRVHAEQHDMTLAAVERGDIQMPEKAVNYLKKHRQKHLDEMEAERPTETIRNERVYCRRICPLRLVMDPWAETYQEVEWIGECFVRPQEVVQEDERYDKDARASAPTINFRDADTTEVYSFQSETDTSSENYVLIYEIIDLREGKVITYAKGGTKPLRVVPYALQSILPSGPYIISSFIDDPVNDVGVPLPAYFKDNQKAASVLSTLSQVIARKSVPKIVYSSSEVDGQELENIKKAEPSGFIPMKKLAGQNLSEIFQYLPTAPIPEQNLLMEDRHIRRVEQLSGLGSAKMGGGDFSKTATASAIVSESSGNAAEDFAAVLDDFYTKVFRAALRLMRRFYDPALVGELVGEDALQWWPEQWSERDILNDRGTAVIPGSSRRKNSAVEQKLLTDLYGILAPDPSFPPNVKIELLKRIFDAYGLYGIDLDGMGQMMALQAAQQALAGQGGEPGAPGEANRPTEATGEPGSIEGGQTNVGGGRIPTGASAGDKPRMMR